MRGEAFDREVEVEVHQRLARMTAFTARPRWQRLLIALTAVAPVVAMLVGINLALSHGFHQMPPVVLLVITGLESIGAIAYATAIAVAPERVIRAITRDSMRYPTNAPGYRSAHPD